MGGRWRVSVAGSGEGGGCRIRSVMGEFIGVGAGLAEVGGSE